MGALKRVALSKSAGGYILKHLPFRLRLFRSITVVGIADSLTSVGPVSAYLVLQIDMDC